MITVNHTKPTSTLYWYYLLTARNYISANGQLQNNISDSVMSITINRVIIIIVSVTYVGPLRLVKERERKNYVYMYIYAYIYVKR